MVTAAQSPIQLAEMIFGNPYLPMQQVRLHDRDSKSPSSTDTLVDMVFETAIRQAIAVHNEALLENVATPDVDVLMQVLQDHLVPPGQEAPIDDDPANLLGIGQRMLEAFLGSEHVMPDQHDQTQSIVGIEHDVSGFIGSGLPPVHGRADLVTITSDGVVVTNYRVVESASSIEQAINDHAGELHLIGALVAGSVDEHSRLAGLRLILLTKDASTSVQEHVIPFDESRLRSMIDLVRTTWQRIIKHHMQHDMASADVS